jgi:hypothetical protein
MAYGQDVDAVTSHRIWEIRLYEMGHSYEEIKSIPLDFLGDVIGYFSEKSRGEEFLTKQSKRLRGG